MCFQMETIINFLAVAGSFLPTRLNASRMFHVLFKHWPLREGPVRVFKPWGILI